MNYSTASDRVVHPYVFWALFITVAGMMGLGILTYNSRLSSWGTVTTFSADNAWLYTLINFQADLMLQTFGIGGIVCISAMVVWGAVVQATYFAPKISFSSNACGCCNYVVNPYRVRQFARAMGRRAKTDKLDAQTICAFGQTMDLPAMEPRSETFSSNDRTFAGKDSK